MARGFPSYAHLGPEAQAAVNAARAADKGAPVVSVGLKGHTKRPILARELAPVAAARGPSKIERRYAAHLESLKITGLIRSWLAQPAPIELAYDCTYQPDFWVLNVDGSVEFVETKGAKRSKRGPTRPFFHDDGARVKTKVAARLLSIPSANETPAALYVAWPSRGGGWSRELVRP